MPLAKRGDVIGREIATGDYVFTNNYLYEVKGVSADGSVIRGFLADPSRTTKAKTLYTRDCCRITKEEYLLYLLTKDAIR